MAVTLLITFLGLLRLALADFPDCTSGVLAHNLICDTTADHYRRAEALVSLFSFEEKINNTQNASPGVPRIGLPPYQWWNEALHGVASSPGVTFAEQGNDYSYATSFPQPILMGAAFDDALIHAVATVVSTEARAFNNGNHSGLNYWTPNINPYRDPRWGRGQETPGEDPYHLSSYVNQLIQGLQGGIDPEPYIKVVATCKHFAGYDIENWKGNARFGYDAIIKTQDLREYYLPPFQQCARDSNAQSIMCSYNAVNGVPVCADEYLLQTVLREFWGFNATNRWVTSDCDAVQNIYNTSSGTAGHGHNYTSTPEQAAADALNAGTDLDCVLRSSSPEFLGSAYNQSLFSMSTLDRSLARRYASLVTLGYFDPPKNQPYRQYNFTDVSTTDSEVLALRAAEEGIVLLKNDGVLPLGPSVKKIALIGPWAAATTQMQGNYAGIAPYLHSLTYAAQEANFSVMYSIGADINSTNTTGFAGAMAVAQAADAVIFAGGIDDTIEAEAKDRNNITWPGNQLDLIALLAKSSKPLIVLQMGTMVDDSSLLANPGVNGLMWGGYPGQDGGTALMNIITGVTAPAGRLPVTQYPGNYVNEVPMTNMSLQPYSSSNYSMNNPGRTYIWYSQTPVFSFGYGLHYTNFTTSIATMASNYSIPLLISKNSSAPYLDTVPFVSIPVTVKNSGTTTSDYVVLGFLSGTFGPAPNPNKRLVSYSRIHNITAGNSQTTSLNLTLGSLGRANADGDMMLYPGDYTLSIDTTAKAAIHFTLSGSATKLDSWPAPPASVVASK